MSTDMGRVRLDRIKYNADAMLGEGGAAEVFRCETPDKQPRILKLYREEALADVDFEALQHTIDWPAALAEEDRTRLLAMSAWPQALVVDGESAVGILMPEAPEIYFLRRNGKSEPRHLIRIAVTKERAEKGGYEYFDFPQKIARLGHVLAALQFLHSIGIVVGDLQFNNLLTTGVHTAGGTRTDVYFLDCDSFIVDGRAGLTNMDPISWRPRYHTQGFSRTTDLFKFALMVIRSLSEQTNQDSISFAQYSHLLPSDDFAILHELLTSPTPSFGANDLGAMARAWQLSVRRDGTMYRRTDQFVRQLWTADMRAAHMAGMRSAVSTERVVPQTAPSGASTKSQRQTAKTGPVRPSPPKTSFSHVQSSSTATTSDKPSSRTGWLVAAGVAALLLAGWVGLAAVDNPDSTSTTRNPSTTRTATTSRTAATPSIPTTRDPVRDARVGDCIHREDGADRGDGTVEVHVREATCGTSYSTDRVSRVVSSPADCGESRWIRDTSPYVIVICLIPD